MRRRTLASDALPAWSFMAPGLLVIGVFVLFPIVYSIPLALTDYSVLGETKFIGLDNFRRAFADDSFLVSLWNSVLYIIVVPVLQILSILIAILVNSRIPGIQAFRAAYYIPVVTSMVAVALMWNWLLSQNGVVNYILITLGITDQKIGWLSTSSTALYVLMFITLWKGLGYYMMLYLAGLQSIPADLYEAAIVDGASRAQRVRLITIPLLRPYIFFCSLISLMGAIRVFDEMFVLTQGGPGTSTLTSSLYIYEQGLEQLNFGYASALGLIVSVIVGVLSVIVFRFNRQGGVNPYG
ncbi:carbohydrate ABC transporter permease [Paenibacillus pasadenensis]|uniref:Putative chitobiose ABC transport system, permease protein 1 n=1 Tax=Paenibacillus pasadenensis TaxID=217090 RepID=A0A2N5N1Y4_9BACL|nr:MULTISPECIES: sugar ABC transporter permease [Paenibacillus]PLT44344.1 putative chitobiose ABC transport system, permease protein 1 [Paenibacillus pasadenensis]QGG54851.1 ABC transporter permease subunit [Paenibacillus sp. B01]